METPILGQHRVETSRSCRAAVIWALNILHLVLSQLQQLMEQPLPHGVLEALKAYDGQLPWRLPFPFVILRMLSYSLDLHALRTSRGPNGADIPVSNSSGDLKARGMPSAMTTPHFSLARRIHIERSYRPFRRSISFRVLCISTSLQTSHAKDSQETQVISVTGHG